MFYRAGSLLLVLLVLGCLQTFTQAQHANEPDQCCFDFFNHPIPKRAITEYKITRPGCAKDGIIFALTSNRSVCADPGMRWVQQVCKKIDQRMIKSTK